MVIADGTFIKYLNGIFTSLKYVGYDISQDVIIRAKQSGYKNAKFTSNLEDFKQILKKQNHAIIKN